MVQKEVGLTFELFGDRQWIDNGPSALLRIVNVSYLVLLHSEPSSLCKDKLKTANNELFVVDLLTRVMLISVVQTPRQVGYSFYSKYHARLRCPA